MLTVGENHSIVLRTLDHEEEKPKPFEEVKEDIVQILQREGATEELTALADDVIEQLSSGAEPAAIATANDATFAEQKALGRNDPEADRELLQTLFSMPKPSEGNSTYQRVVTGGGDIAVAIFGGIAQSADTEQATAADEGTAAPASTEFSAMVAALEAAAKIERNEAVLNPAGQQGGYGM